MYNRYIQGETQSLYNIPVEAIYSGRFSWSPVPWGNEASDVSTRDSKHIGELVCIYRLYTVTNYRYVLYALIYVYYVC